MTQIGPQKKKSYFDSSQAVRSGEQEDIKHKDAVAFVCQWVVNHQISLLVVIQLWNYAVGGESALVQLQYKIPDDPQGRYTRGWRDTCFIAHWAVIFTMLRAVTMYRVLEPFARWYGVRSNRKVTRFGEQGWLTIYYILSNAAGVYVMYNSPHWLNSKGFWIEYPEGHKQMTMLMKLYYLVQMGFWFQQIFVILIEEKRKDFAAMLAHHIITCNLLGWSLYMNYTRVGNAVLCCMDSSDIFLSGTKCIRYLGFVRGTVFSFVLFILSWVFTRHYLYLKIMFSIMYESTSILNYNMWDPGNGSFYNYYVVVAFTMLLGLLQLLIIYWFSLVLRILYRVAFFGNYDDSRSDSEDDGNAKTKLANTVSVSKAKVE
ncbi:TLC domain-containing protein [Coemansia spiralis]|nr:TLC domain-containing protein [Coemansia spiralis]